MREWVLGVLEVLYSAVVGGSLPVKRLADVFERAGACSFWMTYYVFLSRSMPFPMNVFGCVACRS
jgi:hypothetical protein